MTFIPSAGDTVQIPGRPGTVCEVLAVDEASGMMWVRRQGGSPMSTALGTQWEPVTPHPDLPETWHVATSVAVSKGFASRAVVVANLPADAIALIHVQPDGTTSVEWLDQT